MRQILALIDFSKSTGDLLRTAGNMAELMKSRLILLHVAMPFTVGLNTEPRNHLRRGALAEVFRCRHRELKGFENALGERGVKALAMMVRGRSLFGNPVEKIIHVVNRMSPEMILATPHQYSRVAGILTRSVTRSLELVVRCPVLLVPESR